MDQRPEGRCSYGSLSSDHMWLHYVSRCDESARCNLRYIPSRVAVAVGEDTTFFARKPMPLTAPQLPAVRTSLRRVCRIDVDNRHSSGLSFVSDKLLQLPPCPAVKAHTLSSCCPNVRANIRQILHSNRTATQCARFTDDRGAKFVIDVSHMARLPAGDSRQQLPCRLRAIALESRAKRQEPIAPVPEFASPVKSATTGRRGDIFTKVDAEYPAPNWRNVGKFENNMQIPLAASTEKIGLAYGAALHVGTLKCPEAQADVLSTAHSEKGNHFAMESKRSGIEVYRGIASECHCGPCAAISPVRFQTPRRRCYRVAGHLRPQIGKTFTQRAVREVVQSHAIRLPPVVRNRRSKIAGSRERALQRSKCLLLMVCWAQGQSHCPLHEWYRNS